MKNNYALDSIRARGAAMAETIIVFPILMFVGMGIIHLGLIYQAKSNLEYAAFMAARQAAATEMGSLPDDGDLDVYDGLDELRKTVRCRMAAYDPLPEGVVCDNGDLPGDEMAKVLIRVIRPVEAEFIAWGETSPGNPCGGYPVDGCYIPNNNLLAHDPNDDRDSIYLQDANIMTISVRYLVDTGVPFINGFFIGDQDPVNMEDLHPTAFEDDPFNVDRNRPGVWVRAESTMLMQTPATITNVNLCAMTDYC